MQIHLVPHTHWDREWYQPAGRFRQRLVSLIDELLDAPESAPPAFVLDGQAVVLDDYLSVRPERAAELAAALRSGRLEAGPWYVLADELIPGGEALVRNLLQGRRTLRALRAESPGVLYCPDSFGHPAMLPALAKGFGLPVAVLWRGYGGARWPAGDVFRWRAADGSAITVYHLPPAGYEIGSNLPVDPGEAAARWREIGPAVTGRSTTGVALLPNGADHHALQSGQRSAVAALAAAASPHEVVDSSLGRFANALHEAAAAMSLPVVEGELRDSYGHCWTLQGTFATRSYQKRRSALAARMLVRESEPWSALAWRDGRTSRRPLLAAAWRTLLLCHPHDTLCGTSTDEVARAMDARLDDARAQARGIRDDSLLDLVGHDAAAARDRPDLWRNLILLRNPAPRERAGAAELEIVLPRGRVPVGPGSAPDPAAPPVPIRFRGVPVLDDGAIPLQVLVRRRRHHRVESPRHYPYDELADVVRVIAWLPPLAGYSTRAATVGEIGAEETAAGPETRIRNPVREERGALTNGLLSLEPRADGRVVLAAGDGVRSVDSLLALELVREAGDSYTHGPVGDVVTHEPQSARIVERGPLRGTVLLHWRLAPPPWPPHARAPADRAPGRGSITVMARLSVIADSPLLRIAVDVVNDATDHRLRLLVRTDATAPRVVADAAFGPVYRVPPAVPPDEAMQELPPPTAPMHRYVSLESGRNGATVFGDGFAEYEAMPDGTVALTLVRAVGELSRNDVPERPGHAGWPTPTPGAQMRGRFRARHAVMLHGRLDTGTLDAVERAADDVLVPLAGSPLRSALDVPAPAGGITLTGAGLAFSCAKQSEDGEWLVLRCVNLTGQHVSGSWQIAPPPSEAARSRFDETPSAPLAVTAGRIDFEAGPREPVTILVR